MRKRCANASPLHQPPLDVAARTPEAARHAPMPSVIAAFVLCASACQATDEPGELVGVYRITGELSENTCGSEAVPAPATMEFAVELRRIDSPEQSRGLWVIGNPPGSPGRLEPDGVFEFTTAGTFEVDAPSSTGDTSELLEMDPLLLANLDRFEASERRDSTQDGCMLAISEVTRGMVVRDLQPSGHVSAAGPLPPGNPDDPDLVGENQIELRASVGECSGVLKSQGGVFEALPCLAHYDLVGTLEDG